MKFSTFLLFFLLIGVSYLLPQENNNVLISISIKDDYLNNKIEILDLRVIYIEEDYLITLVNNDKLKYLNDLGIVYNKLCDISPTDKLFLITTKLKNDIVELSEAEKIVYRGANFIITKNSKMESEIASIDGLKVIELNGSRSFKNIKKIYQQSNLNTNDSLISIITSSVNSDSVKYYIQNLQNFQTRFLFAETRDSVSYWIKNQFLKMGYTDVIIDSFQYQGTWQKNVVATLPGIYEPEVFNIVGGHHDSYSSGNPMVFAPGADDNASGTAAVLEIARVIRSNNYQPESTIKFITFAAEEYGLWGSEDYAEKALNLGMNIKIMINHDMISHTYYTASQSEVDINRYTGFDYLKDLAFYCIDNYSILSPALGSVNSAGSDSYSFWERGFPSVYFEENNFSPYYHSPADTIGNYNMEYCTEVIKASCATLLLNIVMPTMIQNFKLVDTGIGNSLLASYSPNISPDFLGYKISVGTQSGVYDTVYTTTDTLFNIINLTEGNLYYVGVSVLDQDGNESLIVERSAVPQSIPLTPNEFAAIPAWFEIHLSWNKNSEMDLMGYNIYRSEIEGEPGNILNSSVSLDTTFIDNTAGSGVYYYYSVAAIDSQLNESGRTAPLRSRIVSLDQGILVVDETLDGDGSLMNPTDEQVDEFYDDILTNFGKDNFDLIENGSIALDDLGAYSTVIWHGNDYQDLSAPFNYKESIKEYLSYGGNFLYTGYRPAKAFENVSGNPVNFNSGQFIYDYLKIGSDYYKVLALFNSAISELSGYSSIFVDSTKTLPADFYHLRFIEATIANPDAENIYTFSSNFDSTTAQGSLNGKPIGVEYLGNDFKTITIGLPLYYMNKEQARFLIQHILLNKFNEVLPVSEEFVEIPTTYKLFQNFPNPFNPTTTIKYSIPKSGIVSIKIYNTVGEQVASLVNKEQEIGNYEIKFDATFFSSGIYFYQLKSGDFIETKKMILIK